jgi:exonuclease SbcD
MCPDERSDPLRVLHFADLHIGMEAYGRLDPDTGLNRRVVDFLERLDDVVAHALAHEADLVLFAGDAFRTRRPTPTYQREFARRLHRLSEAGVPTILLVGNHDVPVMEQRASSVAIFDALDVPHVTVAARPELLRVATRRGVVQVAALPYPVRQRLLSRGQVRRMGPAALDRAVSAAVVDRIEALAASVDPALPAVLLGHLSVEGASWGSERGIMMGRDVTVPLAALADPVWDYVALGHIHRHQVLNPEGAPPVVYAGSLERMDFGEEGQPKGFCWVELRRGATAWRFVEVAARPFVTIRADVREAPEPLPVIREAVGALSQKALSEAVLSEAVVRLVVQMTPEQEPRLRDADLAPLLEDAFFAQINREVDRAGRDRLAGLAPDAMTPVRLLARYLRAKGKSEDEIAHYREVAQSIFSEDEG